MDGKQVRKKYVKVRMDDDLYEALARQAKKEKRPMTRMVEIYIERGLRSDMAEWDGIERRSTG